MAQIGSDTFTGNPGEALSTYNPAWVSVPGLTGVMVITSGGDKVAVNSTGGTAGYFRSDIVASSPDYSVSADITFGNVPAGPAFGITGRASLSANTQYSARWLQVTSAGAGTGSWQLQRILNGSSSTLGTLSATTINGQTYRLRLEMIGTSINFYVDDVLVVSATDSNISEVGRPGIRSLNGLASRYMLDNFSVDTPQAAGQPGDASVLGAFSTPSAGTIFASGASSAALTGIRANPSAGIASASGASSAIFIGVAAFPSAGTVVASGASSAQIPGVFAVPGIGIPLALGRASTIVIGVSANPAAGAISAGSTGAAVISGVAAKPSAVDLVVSGASNAIIVGVFANPASGLVTAKNEAGQEDDIDASLVPLARTVRFEGSIRIVAFEGSKRMVRFEGGNRIVRFE